jgi:hypothetical protein
MKHQVQIPDYHGYEWVSIEATTPVDAAKKAMEDAFHATASFCRQRVDMFDFPKLVLVQYKDGRNCELRTQRFLIRCEAPSTPLWPAPEWSGK